MATETLAAMDDGNDRDFNWREWEDRLDPEARAASRELSPHGAEYLARDVGNRGLARLGRMGTTGSSTSGVAPDVRTGYVTPRRVDKRELINLGLTGLTGLQ